MMDDVFLCSDSYHNLFSFYKYARLKTGPACSLFFEKILLFINRLSLIKSAIRGPVPTVIVNQAFWSGFFAIFLLFLCNTSRVVCCAFVIWVASSCSECSTLVFNSTSLTLQKVEKARKFVAFINRAVTRAYQLGPFSFYICRGRFLYYADRTCGCDLCFQAKSL